jgi:hypothetical protein
MGLSQRIEKKDFPQWPEFLAKAATVGVALQLKMIDGLPAFPDETPEESWQELRISTANGMITLRKTADALDLITWGNADDNLQKDVQTLMQCLQV